MDLRSTVNPERLLFFEEDHSLGRVLVRPKHAPHASWTELAQARWAVLVPSGMDVRLWANRATDDDLAALEDLQPNALDELVLLARPITDSGIRHVAGLHGLRMLDLFRTNITDLGLASVAAMVGLDWLSLTGTRVTDHGVARLAGLHALRRLSLKETRITDASLAALADLPELRWLSLTDTRVGDDGLRALAQLSKLQVLSVVRTDITIDGMAWWWQERPDVELVAH